MAAPNTMNLIDRTRLAGLLPMLALAAQLAGPAHAQEPAADGLYAGFVTSQGTFWCQLEYVRAPRTVANFVQLAEGTRFWVDFEHARLAQRPFYNGLTFHRVIEGFMNQSGSPNGLGTDGPGYRFRDEFHPALRHDQAGVLSMANSGPNSNGAQFFVTAASTPWLDDKHSVFGRVVQGLDVVLKINAVPTGTNDVPVTPVVINELRITRVGAAAAAFDPAAVTPPLPPVGTATSRISFEGQQLLLAYDTATNTLDHVFYGADFTRWNFQTFTASPVNATGLLGQPRNFFHVLTGGFER